MLVSISYVFSTVRITSVPFNLLALRFSYYFLGLDTTITADIQGAAVKSLGHIEQLAWLGAGFPLGSVCSIML